jgi:hypothetical protein
MPPQSQPWLTVKTSLHDVQQVELYMPTKLLDLKLHNLVHVAEQAQRLEPSGVHSVLASCVTYRQPQTRQVRLAAMTLP